MPGMDGEEVFRHLRLSGIECTIVILSANGAAAANAKLGGQGAIAKPFDPDTLVAAVRELT